MQNARILSRDSTPRHAWMRVYRLHVPHEYSNGTRNRCHGVHHRLQGNMLVGKTVRFKLGQVTQGALNFSRFSCTMARLGRHLTSNSTDGATPHSSTPRCTKRDDFGIVLDESGLMSGPNRDVPGSVRTVVLLKDVSIEGADLKLEAQEAYIIECSSNQLDMISVTSSPTSSLLLHICTVYATLAAQTVCFMCVHHFL